MPVSCESLLIDDIEDIVSGEDPKPHDRQSARQNVVPRVRKRNKNKSEEEPPSDSIIPGTQKIWVRTWGCSHNNSDGEYMAGQLAAYGYSITETLGHWYVPWSGYNLLYAFPTLPGCVLKVNSEQIPIILIDPHWPRRMWFADLLSLAMEHAWRLPDCPDLQQPCALQHPNF